MEKTHNINIYGDIVPFKFYNDSSEFDLLTLKKSLEKLEVQENDELIINIHTFGGCTETGFAIYNLLQRFKNENKINLTTRVDGICASIGVVILLAGDKRIGNEFAEPFVHNAWTFGAGDVDDVKKVADDLEKVNNKIAELYEQRTKITRVEALELMKNDTSIDIQKALGFGFYTEIENVETSNLIINSIKNFRPKNKQKQIKIKNKMSFKKQINAIYNKIFQSQNKIVYTAENEELDFFELETDDVIEVGSKANINGESANGSFIVKIEEDDYKLTFEGGVLTEMAKIKNADDGEIENLQEEIENLKTQIQEKDSEIEKYKNFKNEILNLKIQKPKAKPKQNFKSKKEEGAGIDFNLINKK